MKKVVITGWIILAVFITLFISVGIFIGRATVDTQVTPEKCTPICIEQYEDYAC